jgi:hypothetical protein
MATSFGREVGPQLLGGQFPDALALLASHRVKARHPELNHTPDRIAGVEVHAQRDELLQHGDMALGGREVGGRAAFAVRHGHGGSVPHQLQEHPQVAARRLWGRPC